MTSITTWVRLEPRSRDRELDVGAEARLHDPLWLLARQWQLGELTGVDGGSAITARTRLELARLDALRTPGGAWTAFDPARAPLDVALAGDAAALERRIRDGRQLQRLLAARRAAASVLLAKFALHIDAAPLDDDDHRYFAAMVGRVLDGDLAAATLAPLLAASDLPPQFGIAAADIAPVSAICRAWLAWRDPPPPASWQPDRLAYRFEARARAAGHDVRLVADRHARGDVAWYDVDAAVGDASARPAGELVATALPSHVRFRGSPQRRYWDLEDSAVRWPSLGAGPGDVARLVMIGLGLTFADHWLVVPIDVPAGSLSRLLSLVVTDTFGIRTLVRTAEALDGASSPWHFCELSRDPALPGPWLFTVPAASAPFAGPSLAAIDLVRDDVADVLWAIDRTVLGGDGRPRNEVAPAGPPPPPDQLTYRLGPALPLTHHPYRARIGPAGLELVRATIPGQPLTVRPDLPDRLVLGTVPMRPVRLQITPLVIRASDGSYHRIRRRDVVATAPAPTPPLAFDRVVPGA